VETPHSPASKEIGRPEAFEHPQFVLTLISGSSRYRVAEIAVLFGLIHSTWSGRGRIFTFAAQVGHKSPAPSQKPLDGILELPYPAPFLAAR
jgi:hypothetical protein